MPWGSMEVTCTPKAGLSCDDKRVRQDIVTRVTIKYSSTPRTLDPPPIPQYLFPKKYMYIHLSNYVYMENTKRVKS